MPLSLGKKFPPRPRYHKDATPCGKGIGYPQGFEQGFKDHISRHLVPLDLAFPAHALVHESELARTDPDPQFLHRPMRYDIGLPSPVI